MNTNNTLRIPVGIIGQGFVGSAVNEGLKDHFSIMTYDKFNKGKTTHTPQQIVKDCRVIFVCVPTPMDSSTGQCYTNIVDEVVHELDGYAKDLGLHQRPILVIKSTVPPGTTDRLNSETNQVDVVFNPEFLTEANAVNDFKNQNRIVIGGDKDAIAPVMLTYSAAFPTTHILVCDAKTAEMVKYTTNTFLATKVSFANEIYDICEALGVDYTNMIDIAKFDTRLGDSHWMVPGPDGDRGFGGHCFPKDLSALLYESDTLGVIPNVLRAVQKTNIHVRTDLDWLRQEGRAVIKVKELSGNE